MQAFRGIARTGEMTLWGTSSPLPHRARSKLVSSPALSTFPALGYFVALSRVLRFLSALGGHQAYVTLVLPCTGGSHSACGAAIQPIAAQLSRVAQITAAQLNTQRAATHTSSVNFIELTQLTILSGLSGFPSHGTPLNFYVFYKTQCRKRGLTNVRAVGHDTPGPPERTAAGDKWTSQPRNKISPHRRTE